VSEIVVDAILKRVTVSRDILEGLGELFDEGANKVEIRFLNGTIFREAAEDMSVLITMVNRLSERLNSMEVDDG
jgi:cytidylate kinase